MSLQDPKIEEARRLRLIVARGDGALREAVIQAELAQCGIVHLGHATERVEQAVRARPAAASRSA